MPIKLTIDGRQVEVEPGATILDAAKQLGIVIPTLCHAHGVEPFASCFLCVVYVEGKRNLIPSCSAPAEEGMVVATGSDDVRAARKVALELLLSDHRGDCVAPCTMACPAGLDIPGFIRHVLDRDPAAALALIKERIPFPGVLGRLCPRYCERVCRRGQLDEPIAVCLLKRCPADKELAAGHCAVPPRQTDTGKSVAIVGAGPAGLSAAFYLLQWGHACTIYDSRPEPGGLFRYGTPQFRLPKAALAAEIEPVRQLGAAFEMGVTVGEDVTLAQLSDAHDAVLLAVGAQAAETSDLPGADLALPAMDLLRRVCEGERPAVGDHVVVIGGGQEAIDAARSAVRLGADRVSILWGKARKAMTCFSEWVDAAEAEGVAVEAETGAVRIEAAGDRFTVACERRGAAMTIDASCVVDAPVRRVDAAWAQRAGLKTSRRGLAADNKTLATSLPGVFAAGEAALGPSVAVRAVASGRLAAVAMAQYLRGEPVVGEPKAINVRLGQLSEAESAGLCREFPEQKRVRVAEANPRERGATFEEVQPGLSDEQAEAEAGRCMQCDCVARDDCKLRLVATEYGADVGRLKGERRPFERDTSHPDIAFEPGKCIACGLCVRVCAQAGEALGMTFTRRGFGVRTGVPFDKPLAQGLAEAGARCVDVCPTGALGFKWRRPSSS